MNEAESVKLAMIAVLLLCMLLASKMLRMLNDRKNTYRFVDLWLGKDGKASKAAHVMWAALFMSTWVVIYLALRNRLTEGYFLTYLAAWVAPQLTGILARNKE